MTADANRALRAVAASRWFTSRSKRKCSIFITELAEHLLAAFHTLVPQHSHSQPDWMNESYFTINTVHFNNIKFPGLSTVGLSSEAYPASPDSSQARPAEFLYVSEQRWMSMGLLPEVLSEAQRRAHHRHQLCQLLHQVLNILLLGPQDWMTGRNHSRDCFLITLAGSISQY